MGVSVPDLGGDNETLHGGITVGPATPPPTPVTPTSLANARNPNSPQKLLQQRWRPESLLDFHLALGIDPAEAPQAASMSRALDQAIQIAHQKTTTLENMIACTQFGQTIVTGSSLGIPTGLVVVTDTTGSIDNGANAHNFTLSVVRSATPGCIDIYVWQPTAAGNTTPTACTSAVTVRWSARGTLQ